MVEKQLLDEILSQRREVAALIPNNAKKILDVGCAGGGLGGFLKEQRKDVEVVGIDIDEKSLGEAKLKLDSVICADIEKDIRLPYPEKYFDCIVFADILEHVREPDKIILKFKPYLSSEGSIVCSIPNIRNIAIFKSLLVDGRWKYFDPSKDEFHTAEQNILYKDHIRFFTLREVIELLESTGFNIEMVQGTLLVAKDHQLSAMFEKDLLELVSKYGGDSERLKNEMKVIQFLVVAKPMLK